MAVTPLKFVQPRGTTPEDGFERSRAKAARAGTARYRTLVERHHERRHTPPVHAVPCDFLRDAKGGHLERIEGISDGSSAPRTIWVWVPDAPATHHLYFHDGQNLFDPGAFHGGWNLHRRVGPNTLVVGIETVNDRLRDLTPWQGQLPSGAIEGGGGDAYANLVLRTIRPLIEARYGTPRCRGVMGASLGGLMALYQAARDPGAWDFAGSVSGTVWFGQNDDRSPLLQRFIDAGRVNTCLYLDSGGWQGGPDNHDSNRELERSLSGLGYRHGESLFHWHQPGARHNEHDWSERVWRPLALFESIRAQSSELRRRLPTAVRWHRRIAKAAILRARAVG